MSNLDMDAAAAPFLDLSRAPSDVIILVLQNMSLSDRFICALVCKAWAKAATAATHSIVRRLRVQDLSWLQCWLEKHGDCTEFLQLHECDGAVLTALPCPQLQNLLLKGSGSRLNIHSSVWDDLAAATKLTSVTLKYVATGSQQADVVAALTALPDLQQLNWKDIACRPLQPAAGRWWLTDSVLLQRLTKLTVLRLDGVAAAEALEHLGGLTRLQDLSLAATAYWDGGCPGLQELKALTRLELPELVDGMSAYLNQLTALQHLNVLSATSRVLNRLPALTGLTQLRVGQLLYLSLRSPPVQLPGLQHLEVVNGGDGTMPMSFLASCTQLRLLKLNKMNLSPGSLAASTILQHLELGSCGVSAADAAADAASWQQVFPGPGRLPHLTSLQLAYPNRLQLADIECVVACCSSLHVLHLDTLPDNSAAALACLPGPTSLTLRLASDQQCSSIAQLTGLRQLRVTDPRELSVAGLVQLAALTELTCLGFVYRFYLNKLDSALPQWEQIYTHVIINEAPPGHPSDVPAQLLRAGGIMPHEAGS